MAKPKNCIIAQAFYLIRSRDIELAEDFLHRCPRDLRTVRELNAFFHQLLSQYSSDTFNLRIKLIDTSNFTEWSVSFINDVLPFLMLNRFPSNTTLRVSSYYSDLTTLAQGRMMTAAVH